MLGGLTPKDKVTLAQFRQTMSQINESILEKLFAQVGDGDESDSREGLRRKETNDDFLVDSDEEEADNRSI